MQQRMLNMENIKTSTEYPAYWGDPLIDRILDVCMNMGEPERRIELEKILEQVWKDKLIYSAESGLHWPTK